MSGQYKVIYSPAAIDDLDSIYFYIAYEFMAKQTALNQVERIKKEIHSLNIFPKRYNKVERKLWASEGMHKMPIDNYVVYYLVDSDIMTVTILRIFYSGKNITNIKEIILD